MMSTGTANGQLQLKPLKRINYLISSLEGDFKCLIENTLKLGSFNLANEPVDVKHFL